MAHFGNLDGLTKLVEANPSIINQRGSKDGYSPLHWAAREGHHAIVKMLLEKGADYGIQGHNGNSPLHVCIHHYVAKSKGTAKAKSIKCERRPLRSSPLPYPPPLPLTPNLTPRRYHRSYTASIVELVNAGANLEDKSKEGMSALAALCNISPEFVSNGFGGKEAFEAMLARKPPAKVSMRSNKGLTPLHYASIAGNWALVELLIQSGANVNAEGSDGYTPIGLVEKRLSKRTARVQYKSVFPLLETTVKVLLKGGAIRRAHAEIPIEVNTNDIECVTPPPPARRAKPARARTVARVAADRCCRCSSVAEAGEREGWRGREPRPSAKIARFSRCCGCRCSSAAFAPSLGDRRGETPPNPSCGRRGRTCARSLPRVLARTCARSHVCSVADPLSRRVLRDRLGSCCH
jgi:hypothetical protein